MTYENLVPTASPGVYTPRVFGFKVHHTSPSLCQTGPKRLSTIEPFQSSDLISHKDGRRSSLPFLDQENEDESDGEYAPLPPPPRLFSPVNSGVSMSSNYSSYPHFPSYSQRSPQLSHESSGDYSIIRGIKRDSSGIEISSSQDIGCVNSLVNASVQAYHPLPSPSPTNQHHYTAYSRRK